MTTDPIALLRDAENYLSALHGSVARHDHLAANLACAGCELRDRIAAALPELAAASSAVVAPCTDHAALRDREKAMLSFALEIAQEEIHARSLDINDQDKAALVSLRRLADETPDTTTARGCPPDCPCRAVCIGTLKPAAGARQDERADDVVTELTEAEFHTAAGRALARLGLTYAELEDQARRRDFSSAQARSLWVTIGGAAPAGARQDGEAQ